MAVPRDILEDLKTFVEVEIQAGRRMAPVDAEAAAAFLAAKPAAPAAAPAAAGPAAATVAATVHRPATPASARSAGPFSEGAAERSEAGGVVPHFASVNENSPAADPTPVERPVDARAVMESPEMAAATEVFPGARVSDIR